VDLDQVTKDEKTMAMLAHLAIFVLGMIGPGIILLINKDNSPYVRYHATQALIFQAISFVISFTVIFGCLLVTFGMCFPIAFIGFIPAIFGLLKGLKANEGTWEGYPMMAQIGLPEGVE